MSELSEYRRKFYEIYLEEKNTNGNSEEVAAMSMLSELQEQIIEDLKRDQSPKVINVKFAMGLCERCHNDLRKECKQSDNILGG